MVEIILTSEEDATRLGREIVITVKDRGRGIKDADKDALFELNVRGDGLIETGNGLGLYCARQAASLQGGDVCLVSSSPNQGSVFKISLPLAPPGEDIQEPEIHPPRRARAVLRWGLAIVGLLVSAALLFSILKPPAQVALLSYHGRYITAMDANGNWQLEQDSQLVDCGKFTQFHLADGKVALLTCHGRYVTAPRKPNPSPVSDHHDEQWLLWQDSGLSDCGQFEFVELPNGKVAFRTCAGMVFTAGGESWPPPMQWKIVAETGNIQNWEEFTLQPQR